VAVIGAGYTGAGAALELARRGRAVVLLDAAAPGSEASSRNGGMAIPGTKGELPDLLAAPGGPDQWHESVAAFAQLERLVADEHIDCSWARSGHVELAVHPRHARRLREAAEAHQLLGEQAHFLGPDELAPEIGSRRFAGGLALERSAALQPAVLLQGLLAAARRAGAVVHGNVRARSVQPSGAGKTLHTTAGPVRVGEVVAATGASSTDAPGLLPFLARRILPVGSFVIATEALGEDLAHSVSPRRRMFFDTRNFLNYWRLSPDGTRILFGGRTSFAPTTVEQARERLYAAMVAVHPQLRGVRVERAWGGLVDLSMDRRPHVGRDPSSGVVYAAGYSGTGVVLSVHLGTTIGRWLGGEPLTSAFADGERFRPVPAAARRPQLLRMAGWWFRARDELGR